MPMKRYKPEQIVNAAAADRSGNRERKDHPASLQGS